MVEERNGRGCGDRGEDGQGFAGEKVEVMVGTVLERWTVYEERRVWIAERSITQRACLAQE
jgi:hypothetical protein